MLHLRTILMVFLFIFSINCKTEQILSIGDTLKDSLNILSSKQTFIDEERVISLELEPNFRNTITKIGFSNIYDFEWLSKSSSTDEKLLYRIQIKVSREGDTQFKDIRKPDFEFDFSKECQGCIIEKKGWIFVKNKNARLFQYRQSNWFFLSIHLNHQSHYVEILISSEDKEKTTEKWEDLKKDIQFL
ncbi:MAG: hypothetical protein NZ853_06675 [Leptospiraceae bacterium]|nr:hypothetical protein [Leptospiraceae bacterium]